jgi:hypothetical protein
MPHWEVGLVWHGWTSSLRREGDTRGAVSGPIVHASLRPDFPKLLMLHWLLGGIY